MPETTTFPILQNIDISTQSSLTGIASDSLSVISTGLAKEFTGDIYSSRGRFGNGTNFVTISATAIQTNNFVSGSAGWQITYAGNAEFNTGTFRGTLTATSVHIPDTTTANSFHVDTNGNSWWGATAIGSATAKVLNTGVATFTDITITGGTVNWSTVSGTTDAPDDNADVTASNTSSDTTSVNGLASTTLIVADKIGANLVESTAINVTSLSAISADLGTITAGNITIDASGYVQGGSTAYMTGTGFWLGYDTNAYKFHVGNPSGDYISWDGTTLTVKGTAVLNAQWSAGDILLSSTDAQINIDNATYTKKRSTQIKRGGTLRIKFSLFLGTSNTSVQGRIYRNDVAVGTERSRDTVGNETFSEDISGWSAGDTVDLYTHYTGLVGGTTSYSSLFRIYVDGLDDTTVII